QAADMGRENAVVTLMHGDCLWKGMDCIASSCKATKYCGGSRANCVGTRWDRSAIRIDRTLDGMRNGERRVIHLHRELFVRRTLLKEFAAVQYIFPGAHQ